MGLVDCRGVSTGYRNGSQITKRDYSLIGLESKLAEERGLANAEWYACKIPRARLKELMQRRDGPAIRDTLIWFAALIISGTLGFFAWHTWRAVPLFSDLWSSLRFRLRSTVARGGASHRLQDRVDERCSLRDRLLHVRL